MSENNELSIIQKADLVSLIKRGGQITDVPFSHDIFLDSFLVAGTYYVDEIEEYAESIFMGVELSLVREPKNPADEFAIMVKDKDGHKLGYVPRKMNKIPARLMDAGKMLFAKVTECNPGLGTVEIRADLFLKD